jgi:hypothetical protein
MEGEYKKRASLDENITTGGEDVSVLRINSMAFRFFSEKEFEVQRMKGNKKLWPHLVFSHQGR